MFALREGSITQIVSRVGHSRVPLLGLEVPRATAARCVQEVDPSRFRVELC